MKKTKKCPELRRTLICNLSNIESCTRYITQAIKEYTTAYMQVKYPSGEISKNEFYMKNDEIYTDFIGGSRPINTLMPNWGTTTNLSYVIALCIAVYHEDLIVNYRNTNHRNMMSKSGKVYKDVVEYCNEKR